MIFTRDQAYEALASLNTAPIFFGFVPGAPLPENLDIYFGPPEEFFIAPDTQDEYTHGRLVPILDDGNFGLVTFLDPSNRALVQVYVESPDETGATFAHWQQYLADLMVRVGESVDNDDRVRRMAELVGFAHTKELFEYFEQVQNISGDAYGEARRLFPLSIAAEPTYGADRNGPAG